MTALTIAEQELFNHRSMYPYDHIAIEAMERIRDAIKASSNGAEGAGELDRARSLLTLILHTEAAPPQPAPQIAFPQDEETLAVYLAEVAVKSALISEPKP